MDRVEKFLLVAITSLMFGVIVFFIVDTLINGEEQKTEETMTNNGELEKVNLDGHEYLIVHHFKSIAVVHNEGCKCKK